MRSGAVISLIKKAKCYFCCHDARLPPAKASFSRRSVQSQPYFQPLHLLPSPPFLFITLLLLLLPLIFHAIALFFSLWMAQRSVGSGCELCLRSGEKCELNAAQAVCHADGRAVVLIGSNASEMFLLPLSAPSHAPHSYSCAPPFLLISPLRVSPFPFVVRSPLVSRQNI